MENTAFIQAPEDSGVPFAARDFGMKDRVVIITGAGQGIGRELARQFAAAEAITIVADLNAANADRVVGEIDAARGRGMAVRVDIGSRESVDAMVAAVIEPFGKIDVLVNNAGIFATLKKRPFDQIPLEEWNQVMNVNITGVFNAVCAVAPHMRQAGWGRIVNIASNSPRLGVPNYLHYIASKAAVIGMSASLARELGPQGINGNCIRPGGVATEVDREVNPTLERRQQMLSQQCIPKGQVATDLVGLVMFLSSNAASFITGQTIACDGGLTHNS